MAQCGCILLCNTVYMGMTITNCWKMFRYGVKRDQYINFIVIREFLEQLAMDCFSNPFTTDTGTQLNNIPSLCDIDK